MDILPLTKGDFDWILEHFDQFWPDDATRPRHHPIFVNELSNSAFVLRDDDGIAAYLLGLIAQSSPTGYIHLVAVRRQHRRRGLARRLYDHFTTHARAQGCSRLKATAAPWNRDSIGFHLAYGMRMAAGEETADGVQVVRDYGGPGIDRVIFIGEI